MDPNKKKIEPITNLIWSPEEGKAGIEPLNEFGDPGFMDYDCDMNGCAGQGCTCGLGEGGGAAVKPPKHGCFDTCA